MLQVLGTPPQRGLKINNGKIIMIDKKNYKTRTQDLNKIYHDVGQFCWGKTDSWLKKNLYFQKKVLDSNYQDIERLI